MTISSDRQAVIDFTQPYMTFGLAFIIRVKDVSANYFRFLLPFDKSLWIALCVLVMVMSLLVWVCSVFSPWGYYGRCVQVESVEKVNEMKEDPTPHDQFSRHACSNNNNNRPCSYSHGCTGNEHEREADAGKSFQMQIISPA